MFHLFTATQKEKNYEFGSSQLENEGAQQADAETSLFEIRDTKDCQTVFAAISFTLQDQMQALKLLIAAESDQPSLNQQHQLRELSKGQ
jgi:hypothetical protein